LKYWKVTTYKPTSATTGIAKAQYVLKMALKNGAV
jgi:hypothetical protein